MLFFNRYNANDLLLRMEYTTDTFTDYITPENYTINYARGTARDDRRNRYVSETNREIADKIGMPTAPDFSPKSLAGMSCGMSDKTCATLRAPIVGGVETMANDAAAPMLTLSLSGYDVLELVMLFIVILIGIITMTSCATIFLHNMYLNSFVGNIPAAI